MPPEQLVPKKKGDKTLYAYFAPGTQRYVGDEAAYQRFINLAVMQNLEPRRRAVTETNPDDPQFWTLWENSQGGGCRWVPPPKRSWRFTGDPAHRWERQAWQVGLAFSFLQMDQFLISYTCQIEN